MSAVHPEPDVQQQPSVTESSSTAAAVSAAPAPRPSVQVHVVATHEEETTPQPTPAHRPSSPLWERLHNVHAFEEEKEPDGFKHYQLKVSSCHAHRLLKQYAMTRVRMPLSSRDSVL